MNDFKRYANMFYSYKSVSFSSAPECLRNPKKRTDPTPAMDSYSFAMIMWELLHDQQPFDGSLEAATQFVIEQDARPAIYTSQQSAQLMGSVDISEMHEEVPESQEKKQVLNQDLANIIRQCWQTDPAQRPSFTQIYKMLKLQQSMIESNNEEITLNHEA